MQCPPCENFRRTIIRWDYNDYSSVTIAISAGWDHLTDREYGRELGGRILHEVVPESSGPLLFIARSDSTEAAYGWEPRPIDESSKRKRNFVITGNLRRETCMQRPSRGPRHYYRLLIADSMQLFLWLFYFLHLSLVHSQLFSLCLRQRIINTPWIYFRQRAHCVLNDTSRRLNLAR